MIVLVHQFIWKWGMHSQQTHDVVIMSLLHQKDIVMLFWHNNGIIITSCVCCVSLVQPKCGGKSEYLGLTHGLQILPISLKLHSKQNFSFVGLDYNEYADLKKIKWHWYVCIGERKIFLWGKNHVMWYVILSKKRAEPFFTIYYTICTL